jgi:hypothetical protein
MHQRGGIGRRELSKRTADEAIGFLRRCLAMSEE